MKDGSIATHFTAGTSTHAADTVNDGDIKFTGQINGARREPDAIAWTPHLHAFAGRPVARRIGDLTRKELRPGRHCHPARRRLGRASEITRINDTNFAVLERDNQQRRNARVKRIYSFSIAGLSPAPAGATPPTVTKTLVRDLLKQDNFLIEKAEGMVLTPQGDYVVASDNDGGGETLVVCVLNQRFDLCLQDERSGDVLRLNSLTGEYLFIRCGVGGFMLQGRGAIDRTGCNLRLADPRLRVEIEDCPGAGERRGEAAFRTGPLGARFFIRDGNLNDNDCVCR
ncbi:MAG: esterase-like activity of phytase family protein [Blastocatellia bacterium]